MNEPRDLIARCRQGDDLAWEALVRSYEGRVYAVAFHYLRNREEARDTAQDIFVKVYQNLHTLLDDKPFLPWLLRLARNACIDRIRRLRVRTPEREVAVESVPEIRAATPTPEEDSLRTARQRLVYRALGELTETNREMILLKEIQGLKLEEIASLLEVPLGTVKSRSKRARVQLGKAILTLDPGYGV